MKKEEQLSQFLDGEMDSAQSANLVKQCRDQDAQQQWSRYHLIGDAMRGDLPDVLSHGLAARVSAALDDEPNLFAPNALQQNDSSPVALPARDPVLEKEQRSPRFAWGLGLAASVAMVGVLSLQTGQQTDTGLAGIPVAQAPATIVAPVNVLQPHISTVAGIDRPVVKPTPPAALAEINPVPGGSWKRLDLSHQEFSPYVQPSSEFSVAPGAVPSRPMAQVASFGENKAQ